MQSSSDKENYTKQQNSFHSEGINPLYYTASPLHKQRKIVVVPIQANDLGDNIQIPITRSLKIFLSLSGFIFVLWGLISFSFQMVTIIYSYSASYYGLGSEISFILEGTVMMIAGLVSAYPLIRLIRMNIIILILCITGLALSIVNYLSSERCISKIGPYCDEVYLIDLKIGLIITFSLAAIHTLINIFYLSKEKRRAMARSHPTMMNA